MLDWFSGYVGYDASGLAVGRFFLVDAHGQVVRDSPRWETARGSYAAGIQVTQGSPTDRMLADAKAQGFLCSDRQVLRVSGNPSKYLQGHNAAGPSVRLLGPVLQAVVRAFGEGMRPPDADQLALPAVHRSRVDVTTAVDLGSHQAVHEWIELAAATTRSRHGRAMDSSGTVYWGKNSTRWSIKAYCKHCELQKHRPDDEALLPDLLEWTRTHLRIELTLRRPELRDRGALDESVIWEYFSKLEIRPMKSRLYAPEHLRYPLRLVLESWYGGGDPKSMLPRRTLYKYRRELIDATGVDILLPYSEQHGSRARAALLGMDELRAREVTDVPARIQRSLFGSGV